MFLNFLFNRKIIFTVLPLMFALLIFGAVLFGEYTLVLVPFVLLGTVLLFINPQIIPFVFMSTFFIGIPIKEITLISIKFTDILFTILIISMLPSVVKSKDALCLNNSTKKIYTILIIFSIACIFSVLFNIHLKKMLELATSAWYFFSLVQLILILLFFSQANMASLREKIITFCIVFSIFEQFVALYQYLNLHTGSIEDMRNVSGTYDHHAMLGNITIIALALLIYRLYSTSSNKLKIVYGIGILSSIYTMIISSSRSGLLGIAISIVIYLIVKFRFHFKYIFIIILICTIASIVVKLTPLNDIILNTFQNERTATVDISTYGRFLIWRGALLNYENGSIFQKLFGIGFGNFFSQKYPFILFESSKFVSGAHNNLLHVLVETGIFGLIIFVSYFIVTIIELKKGSKKDKLAMPFIFATVALFFSGMTQETFWFQPAFGAFWMYHMIFVSFILINNENVKKIKNITEKSEINDLVT